MSQLIHVLSQQNRNAGTITSPSVALPAGVTSAVFTLLLPQTQIEDTTVSLNLGVRWLNPASGVFEDLLNTDFQGGVTLGKGGVEILQPKFECDFPPVVQGQPVQAWVTTNKRLNIGFDVLLLP